MKERSNISLKPLDDIFSTEESRADAQREKVTMVPLDALHPFRNHPFKVVDDEKMMDTAQSIREHGVLVPAIVRPLESGGYELVSGHRRKRGCELAGLDEMPVIIRDMDDDSRFNVNENMMEEVSSVFSESASLDRFHGFIPGWEIPRMHQGLIANGWALNTEYFAEVLHLLRDDLTYTTIVDECLAVPAKPDKRDLTAIKRLCTAFVKLLYPNATCKEDIPADEFIKYCLEPAKEMRSVIKKQLCIIDPKEFNVPGKKNIPDIQYNYL